MKLEEQLISLRKERGLSQDQVAELLDLSRQSVSRWERGVAKPSTDNLMALAKVYQVPLDYFVIGEAALTAEPIPAPTPMQEPAAPATDHTRKWKLCAGALLAAVVVLGVLLVWVLIPEKEVHQIGDLKTDEFLAGEQFSLNNLK